MTLSYVRVKGGLEMTLMLAHLIFYKETHVIGHHPSQDQQEARLQIKLRDERSVPIIFKLEVIAGILLIDHVKEHKLQLMPEKYKAFEDWKKYKLPMNKAWQIVDEEMASWVPRRR